jgi:hypothetical protein
MGTDEERLAALLPKLQEVVDRMEIEKAILRVSRGMDRHDTELANSGFHPDGRDDHVLFVGPAREAIDWMETAHDTDLRGHQHYVTNMTIEIDGDEAHVESYNIMAGVAKDSWEPVVGGGRYLDRLERRDGEWRIVDRVSTGEWWSLPNVMEKIVENVHPHSADRDDISYMRPLKVLRPFQQVSRSGATD